MPAIEANQLQSLIDTGGVCAFSVDTNVFHRFGYNLQATTLLALAQFAPMNIDHVVTDVVEREVRAHVTENLGKASADLAGALRRYARVRRDLETEVAAASPALGVEDDFEADTARKWAEFLACTNGRVLTASELLDGDALVAMYFDVRAPFEATGDKKSEFPDAIALLELEAHGARAGRNVLAVSRDGGWAAFAADAQWLVVVPDLTEALAMFNRGAAAVADRVAQLLPDRESVLSDQLVEKLTAFVDGLNPEVEAETPFEFSSEFNDAEIADVAGIVYPQPIVIESDADTVKLSMTVELPVTVRASFSFYVHDSVDDDYLGMGEDEAEREIVLSVPLTMIVSRDVYDEGQAREIRIERLRQTTVNFGYIEPNGWRDEGD